MGLLLKGKENKRQSHQQGERQLIFNSETLGAQCRHARMFVLPAQYFREDIKHPR